MKTTWTFFWTACAVLAGLLALIAAVVYPLAFLVACVTLAIASWRVWTRYLIAHPRVGLAICCLTAGAGAQVAVSTWREHPIVAVVAVLIGTAGLSAGVLVFERARSAG